MLRWLPSRRLLPLAALTLVMLLGGCVAYPAYPGYGYAYYPGGVVAYGGGWGWHDHDGGWRHY